MKVLTILVPVYNVEKYVKRCLDSLLAPEVVKDIEILIVNDGSKDASADIVRSYCEKYPETIVFVDKENGGHGSTINVGIEKAQGKYFRVLDSDDWFNTVEFVEFVKRLKNEDADVVVCDYRKEHTYDSHSEFFSYNGLKENQKYVFDEIDLSILNKEYFMMATTTYRTDVIRASGLRMLEKTFYVDMQYNIVPITKVNTFVYYHLDIYRYFIGRKEQSMNMNNFVRNQNHHKMVMTWMLEFYTEILQELSENKKEYIENILAYTLNTHYSIYCEHEMDYRNAYNEIKEFDKYLLEKNISLYDKINSVEYIRYNRKTKFIFVKINSKKWNDFLYLAQRVKGRLVK